MIEQEMTHAMHPRKSRRSSTPENSRLML